MKMRYSACIKIVPTLSIIGKGPKIFDCYSKQEHQIITSKLMILEAKKYFA